MIRYKDAVEQKNRRGLSQGRREKQGTINAPWSCYSVTRTRKIQTKIVHMSQALTLVEVLSIYCVVEKTDQTARKMADTSEIEIVGLARVRFGV